MIKLSEYCYISFICTYCEICNRILIFHQRIRIFILISVNNRSNSHMRNRTGYLNIIFRIFLKFRQWIIQMLEYTSARFTLLQSPICFILATVGTRIPPPSAYNL